MLKKAATLFGVLFILIGILGFVPGITNDGMLLSIFHVNTSHNLIHIVSGIAALTIGMSSEKGARTYFQVFGVVYALVTVLGFMSMDSDILGLVANNMADNLLHIVIATSALYLGFATKEELTA